ncbi:MAG: 4-(cytidine 5'-diphospho)-2-C-methyl-D-erythritol kinase [Alistipes sp.]|nr:4-(cytidine 5'-diphospho)-2-C-methyl-D-erythritol kinase [Alistipes sp.]
MVFFPCCKINIGLDILRRREDGYHDIETVMFPVSGLCDILEIVPSGRSGVEFSSSGLAVDCRTEDNLCVRAYRAVEEKYGIGGVKIHLHKTVPFGAGLGGGSADAVYTVKGLSQVFGLGMDEAAVKDIAAGLGSDTVFFAGDGPALSSGRGEVVTPITVDNIRGMLLVIIKPPVGVSTAAAYASVSPAMPRVPLAERIEMPVDRWREVLKNDFERPVFAAHPQIARIKEGLYDAGAVYASMSGSGSAVFGLFRGEATMDVDGCGVPSCIGPLKDTFADYFVYHEVIS